MVVLVPLVPPPLLARLLRLGLCRLRARRFLLARRCPLTDRRQGLVLRLWGESLGRCRVASVVAVQAQAPRRIRWLGLWLVAAHPVAAPVVKAHLRHHP